jgi:hypothetical protein
MKRTLFIFSLALCLWGCDSPDVAPAKKASPPTVASVGKNPTISLEAIFLRVPADKLPALRAPTREQLRAILADSPDSCRKAMLKVITIPGKKVTAVSGERVAVTTAARLNRDGTVARSFTYMDQGVKLTAMPFWQEDALFLSIDTSITDIVPQPGIVLLAKPLVLGSAKCTHTAKSVIPCTPERWTVLGGRNAAKFNTTTQPGSATETISDVWYVMLQANFVSPEPNQP